MRANGVVLLDSYRLAQYAESAPCYICAGGNNFDADRCRHCQAPMALAHQASSQKIHPKMIAAIGPSGAGKTVYLGMLTDMLSRQTEPMQMLPRGAFSIGLQQTTMSSLSRCEFPAKTPSEPDRWNWVHCQILRRKQRPVELILPDLAGEALMEEVEYPHTYPVVRSFLAKCSGVLVMVDAERLGRGETEEDFQTMKLISYLCELKCENKQSWGNRPVSLVFTKADECTTCFDDPQAFARQHAPGLFQQCRERLPRHRFFGVGVAGACAYRSEYFGRVHVPLRIEPRGIVEPFRWLVEELVT